MEKRDNELPPPPLVLSPIRLRKRDDELHGGDFTDDDDQRRSHVLAIEGSGPPLPCKKNEDICCGCASSAMLASAKLQDCPSKQVSHTIVEMQ